MTLLVEGQPRTEAASGRIVLAVDLAQHELQQGPRLPAPPIRVDLLATDERFPRFAERAAHTGVQSSRSLPVVVDGEVVGSLNLYSSVPAAFDLTSPGLGAVLASQVGVAVAKSGVLAAGQQVAVSAQEVCDEQADIGVAQGMLMVLEQCDSDQAAGLLRYAASTQTQTLVEIARRVIAEVRSQPGRPTSPSEQPGDRDP